MGVSYNKLLKLLEQRNMTKTQLREELGISTSTLAKLSSNRPVTLDIIERICVYFNVGIEDVLEFDKTKQ
jgi:DNA-binding Xre family transcriptional regulator